MRAAGAYLRDVSGWESADWYAGPGHTAQVEPGWGPQPWFAQWQAEHEAVRTRVGLIDMSFMSKWRGGGPPARGARGGVRGPARRREEGGGADTPPSLLHLTRPASDALARSGVGV